MRQCTRPNEGEHGFTGPARVAVDEPNRRFAVTDGERIVVINMDREAADLEM